MMKQTKHLILTPFNFSFFGIGVNPLTDEWMERRMQVFMDVTYSSLMSQTVMDFEWIVGFDPQTPTKWREKINGIKNINAVYPDKPSPKVWPQIVKQYIDTEYLLTTRIDNDDAFANNAIKMIQSVAEDMQPRYINFLYGLVTDGNILYRLNYESNSFISRLEESSKAKSVRTIDHTAAKGTKYFQQINNISPMWLIYIHDLNYKWTMKAAQIGHLRHCSPAKVNDLDVFKINLSIKRQYEK